MQNTGTAAWQAYGLRVKLYSSRRKLIKFPSGSDFSYSVIAPWPAGLAAGIDAPMAVPGLNEFIAKNLASGVYYYLAELYVSPSASGPAELFRRTPADRGTLKEVRIHNPSVFKRNAAVTAVEESSATVKVTLKNFSNSNFSGLALKLLRGGALAEERAVETLPAQQELVLEFTAPPAGGDGSGLKAVLVVDDDYPEDNYLTAEGAQ